MNHNSLSLVIDQLEDGTAYLGSIYAEGPGILLQYFNCSEIPESIAMGVELLIKHGSNERSGGKV